MNLEQVNSAWDKVSLARCKSRPTSLTLIKYLCPDFVELHGDRLYGDDPSIIGGIGFIEGIPVTIIAQEKGQTTEEKIMRNFGMPHPEGYRKTLRLMKQAEKFQRPVLLIIDTPGAYPGIGAEERGASMAIASNLWEMSALKVPLIGVVLGEGGSGGALAIGVCDRIFMLENAIYAILSPEGFASIYYKDGSLAQQAAEVMKLTAQDLFGYGIIDGIIPETAGGLHKNPEYTFSILKDTLITEFKKLLKTDIDGLVTNRYDKFRKIGGFDVTK